MQYRGTIDGVPAILEVDADGETWRGRAEVGGQAYALEGRRTDSQVQGVVTEVATGQAMPLQAVIDDRGINLLAPVHGRLELANGDAPLPAPQATSGGAAAIDGRLVGNWLWTTGSFTGDISVTIQERLILNADGTYVYGDAQAVGSGIGVSFDAGGDGPGERGRWRTEGDVLYQGDVAGAAFAPYARFEVDQQSLLLLFPDGSKRLWSRA